MRTIYCGRSPRPDLGRGRWALALAGGLLLAACGDDFKSETRGPSGPDAAPMGSAGSGAGGGPSADAGGRVGTGGAAVAAPDAGDSGIDGAAQLPVVSSTEGALFTSGGGVGTSRTGKYRATILVGAPVPKGVGTSSSGRYRLRLGGPS